MTAAERDLLELVALGLGNKELIELSDKPEWGTIYRLAEEQAVIGLLAEGLSRFKSQYDDWSIADKQWKSSETAITIDYQTESQLFEDSLDIVNRNKQINHLQNKVLDFLEKQGTTAYIKKGQAVAQYYPNPLQRMSGDIDVVVREEDYERAKTELQKVAEGAADELSLDRHIALYFGDDVVELHATEFGILSAEVRKYMQMLTREMFATNCFRILEIDGYPTRVANTQYDALYLFLHLLKHYHYEGVGIRQFIDWGMCLKHLCSTDAVQRLQEHLIKLRLEKQWNILGSFLIHNLGFQLDLFPEFQKQYKGSDIVEKVVFYSGNMGYRKWQIHKLSYLRRIPLLVKDNYYMAIGFLPFSRMEFVKQFIKRNWHDFSKSFVARVK